MFSNILDVCGNKRIMRIRELSLEEVPLWKQSWTAHPQCSQQENGKSFLSSSSAASIRYKVPQLCPTLSGQEILPWKCLKGIPNVPENQKSPNVLPGV